jgi:hypothetical protein
LGAEDSRAGRRVARRDSVAIRRRRPCMGAPVPHLDFATGGCRSGTPSTRTPTAGPSRRTAGSGRCSLGARPRRHRGAGARRTGCPFVVLMAGG